MHVSRHDCDGCASTASITMTKDSIYSVARIDGLGTPLPTVSTERDCAFELTDSRWRLIFRDGRTGLSGGLFHGRLAVEDAAGRACRVTIEDVSGPGFHATVVVRARAAKVRKDLEARLASLERSGEIVANVEAGSWWLDSRVFDDLDWSQRRSLAGVSYRAGWWGTGRLQPSMLPKVLDFGPRGVVLRGWRVRLAIPWDAIASLHVLPGDFWVPTEIGTGQESRSGASVVIRSFTDQDAVFYTPLVSVGEADAVLGPLIRRLEGAAAAGG